MVESRAKMMLQETNASLLIIEERQSHDIVVGVPHHAPAGTNRLPCTTHKDADENAGFLGLRLAEQLDCCSIIACNYRVDVNKCPRSDYMMQIARWSPKVLVEIHGHGGEKAHHDIEISSGRPDDESFSKQMAEYLARVDPSSSRTICGEYAKIYFKASQSVTISDPRWIAYHIELPPDLRKQTDASTEAPPENGYALIDAVAEFIRQVH